jgi:hypothetical protein
VIGRFLSAPDARRAGETLSKLAAHDLSDWAIAGGWAVEIHCLLDGREPSLRALADLDFVTPSFDRIPISLAASFLFRHVHPLDPPGKTLMQLVDAETALRIDVFRACGRTMARARDVEFPSGRMRVVAREDVIARGARLLLDLESNVPVARKHARDYLRISDGVPARDLDAAWPDHRKPGHPAAFPEADALVRKLISTRGHLLIEPQYSTDPSETCPRCIPDAAFPLADPARILALLGYC